MNIQNIKYNWNPPTDVYETAAEIIIKVEIAGMDENDFEITLEKNLLQIRGTRIDQQDQSKKAYHKMEIGFGEFSTKIEINTPIDQNHTFAQYDNGFLTVTLPKSTPKQIKIQKTD